MLTIERILEVQQSLPADGNIELAIRLYRCAPSSFVLATDESVFVRPYTYTEVSPHGAAVVTQYASPSQMPRLIRGHFDAVWDRAIPYEEVVTAGAIGLDKGARTTGHVATYVDPETASIRIAHLIGSAQSRVWVQGVALDLLFTSPVIAEAMNTLLSHDTVDVRVLLLDPDSREARRKSFRYSAPAMMEQPSWEAIQSILAGSEETGPGDEDHRASKVYQDITGSINRFAVKHRRIANLEVRLTDTAPVGFVLIADDHLLTEQYHYGRLHNADDGYWDRPDLQLAEEMPLNEYKPVDTDSSVRLRGRSPQPFAVLEDHYKFVFEYLSHPI
ncbi:hypothetical protein GCM10029992_32530 [Glycomyces albus]